MKNGEFTREDLPKLDIIGALQGLEKDLGDDRRWSEQAGDFERARTLHGYEVRVRKVINQFVALERSREG